MSIFAKFSLRLFLSILVTANITACQTDKPKIKKQLPLPQDNLIQVYFNHNQAAEYIEPYRQKQRAGDNLEQIIIDGINSAKFSIDVAVQELRLPNIAKALVDRHKAGVKVRVILENIYTRPFRNLTDAELAKMTEREGDRYQELRELLDIDKNNIITPEEINQRDAVVLLKNAGIPIIDDTADGSKGSGLMHHKFVLIDGKNVIITSANFTMSDIHGDFRYSNSLGNANNLIKIDNSELTKIFTQEFNIMWGDGPGNKSDSKFGINKPVRSPQQIKLLNSTITVQFSPTSKTIPWQQSSNGLIGKNLNTATKLINIALFVFSEQRLADILQTRHQQGVEIKALIDANFAYRSYSEALDMMGVAIPNESCQYEKANHPWQKSINTVGVPLLSKGDLLHHKFGIIDDRTIITGSHNWTVAADNTNDETVIIIENPTVTAHFNREFERLYQNANLGITPSLQQKIQMRQKLCPQTQKTPIASPGKITENNPNLTKAEITTKVNLNTASQAELEALPGVGPKLVQRIIAARQKKPFTSLEDLNRVSGVGPKMLEKLRDRVTW